MNMAYGLPTIINDYASFSEFPNDATCKVELNSKEDLIDKIKLLIDDESKRKHISQKAYEYIIKEHNVDQIAKEYYEFVSKSCKTMSKPINITEEVADIIVAQQLDKMLVEKEYLKIAKIIKGSFD